jgi:hypothetical protein
MSGKVAVFVFPLFCLKKKVGKKEKQKGVDCKEAQRGLFFILTSFTPNILLSQKRTKVHFFLSFFIAFVGCVDNLTHHTHTQQK